MAVYGGFSPSGSGQLEAAYVLQAPDKMIVSPVVGIRYSQVERGAYIESSESDFPYQYGKMESKQTNLFAGIQANLSLSKQVNIYAKSSRDSLSAQLAYTVTF